MKKPEHPLKAIYFPEKKNLLIISLIFLFCSLFSLEAFSQNRKFSFHLNNVTVQEIVKEIEKSSDFVFIFSEDVLDEVEKPDSISVSNVSIDSLLSELFHDLGLEYRLLDKQVVVFKSDSEGSFREQVRSVEKQEVFPVKGTVVDVNGDPVVGATVRVKGTNTGVMTDFDGSFSLKNVDQNGVLVFTFVGFETIELPINGRNNLDVILKQSLENLDEIVVTSSYGTAQKRENLVSSVYEVKSEAIEHMPAQRVDQLLEGLVPGLEFNPQSDDASSSRPRYSVTIRGKASMSASNEPLWIVDGTPLYTGDRTNMISGMQTSVSPLSYLNPEDIESITVLKDASATSLYGADGANGVILITTKKGMAGKMRLTATVQVGATQINESTRFKVLSGEEYQMLARESYENAGLAMNVFPFTDNPLNNYSETSVDWYDAFYDRGSNAQVNLSASGGSEKATYYISGSYYKNKGTLIGNDQERFTLRSSNTLDLSERLSMQLTLGGSYNTNSLFTPGHEYYENIPIISPYNEDGSYRMYYRMIEGMGPNGEPNWIDRRYFNAVAEREQNDNDQRTFAFQGNYRLIYELLDGLTYTGRFGVDYLSSDENIYNSMKNWSGKTTTGEPGGSARWSYSSFLNWTTAQWLSYDRQFGLHEFDALVAFEASSRDNRTISSYGSGFVNDNIRAVSYATTRQGSSGMSSTKKVSFLGNLKYGYDDRYNAQVNVRKDGNSGFGKDVRWANFASLGLDWNIHNESFFNSNTISHLSLKGSYGSNGNSRLGRQEAQGVYSIGENYNYAGQPGAGMSTAPNPTLSWETTYMTNIGLRLGLFNNRINLDTEVYRNKTENLLSNLDASRTTGTTRVMRNMGAIENRGIEMVLTTRNFVSENFNWTTNIIGSHNENEILELYNDIPKNFNNTRWEEGKDINTYYLVRWAGVDPRDGAPLWYDINGNITRNYNNIQDRVATKSSTPDVFGSITNDLEYKNFRLRVQANYTIGGYAFSSYGRNVTSDGLNIMSENQSVNQLDRWQNPGDITLSPKPLWGMSTQSVMHSTRYLYSKTHIKLQHVTLSYTVDREKAMDMGLQDLRVSLIGDNLGVWTPYDQANRNSYKNNMYGYPMETGVSLALTVSF